MDNKYLLSYLKDFFNDPRMNRVLDYFKVDLDFYLYAYGSQFRDYDNLENTIQYMYGGPKRNVLFRKKTGFINWLRHKAYILASRRVDKTANKRKKSEAINKKVLFIENVSIEAKSKFSENNITVYCLDDYLNKNHSGICKIFEWYDSLYKLSFKERLELERYTCLDDFIVIIQDTFKDFDGLFVGNEEYFKCKLFIDAFKGIGIPTYNWSHGIDCTYEVPMRVDYQLVWGKGVKDNLVRYGRNKDSIIVAGNIRYFDVPKSIHFRNSLEDVLVLTSVTVANIRHSWEYEYFDKWDRSLLLTYIYSVEKVLKDVGIKHARLRPHPINNKLWLEKFIDTDFFSLDDLRLDKSLERASLAIGPNSSTFVEALRKGVTYLVYEPGDDGKNLLDTKLNPPFDGSDENLKVAFNEEQLKELIVNRYSCNQNILDKYIVPFDINSFKHTLGRKG